MSNHLAIATATAALAQIVRNSAEGGIGRSVEVSFARPSPPGSGTSVPRVHIYLHQVAGNPALSNADLPTRGPDGRRVRRPRVALDLHYLIAFFGDEAHLEPHRMMGAVARDLHAMPVLGRQAIEDAITSHGADLQDSDLADEVEQVKFMPLQLSLDEQSKLWSVFVQTPHAFSLVYQGTVVLIDALEGAAAALPVLRRGDADRGVEAIAGALPRLRAAYIAFAAAADLVPRLPSLPNAQLGAHLRLLGRNLQADEASLRFSHPRLAAQDVVIPAAQRASDVLAVLIPEDAAAQTNWAAGLYSVQALCKAGGATRASNAVALALAPRILSIDPQPAVRDAGGEVTLGIACSPRVLPIQSAVLLLADREFEAEPHPVSTDPLTFVLSDAPVLTGALARVRVDGIESLPFVFDAAQGRLIFDDNQRITIQ